jgi:hypothetical protein
MANMDDYSRAAKQAQECGDTNGTQIDDNSDSESNGDDLTGTRYDIEGVLDRAAAAWGTTATPLPLGPTHFVCLKVTPTVTTQRQRSRQGCRFPQMLPRPSQAVDFKIYWA